MGELPFPQGLIWALSYIGSVANSRLFVNVMKLSSDQRMIEYLNIQQLSPFFFSNKFYPKLYPLTLDIYDVPEGSPVPGDYVEEEEEGS